MQVFEISGVRIEGVCACVPEQRIDNAEVLRDMYGDEAAKIIKATGIRYRYIAHEGMSSGDLCLACARELLKGTNTAENEIGGIVFVTFTPDRLLPFNAAAVQERLGLEKEIPAFDISLACSGYPYGVYVASFLAKSCGRKVLLLDGDIQSAYMSEYDKATVPVLADGGSATLISADAGAPDTWRFAFYTDGAGKEQLTIPAGGSASPMMEGDLEFAVFEDGSRRRGIDIYMDGMGVYSFVAQTVSEWLVRFLEEIRESSETIDSFVPHQANMYMVRQLSRKLGFSWDRTWKSGNEVGNSGSATIPVTIAKGAGEMLKPGKDNAVLISGFGAGFSASAGMVTLSPDGYYQFFQYGTPGKTGDAKGQNVEDDGGISVREV